MVIAMKLIFPFLVASSHGLRNNTGAISIGKDSWMLSRKLKWFCWRGDN